MRTGRPLKKFPVDESYDAIIVGSGMGALTTGAILAKGAGKRVLLLERHYTAGGFMHSFNRPGYEWDVGVHYVGEITTPGGLGQILDYVTDGRVTWADLGDCYDEIVVAGDRYRYVRGKRAWRDQMCEYFPGEVAGIDRYIEKLNKLFVASRLFFGEKVLPPGVSRFVGPMMRSPMMKLTRPTVHEVLRDVTSDPRLRAVLAGQWGDYGLPPRQASFAIHSMVTQHYFRGGFYPVGGANRIVKLIEEVLENHGGRIATNAPVERILVERGRAAGVQLETGQVVRAPIVISNAGVPLTARMLADDVPAKAELEAVVANTRPSGAHVSLYVGADRSASELGLPANNIWVYPGDDHDAQAAAWFRDPDAPLPLAFLSFASARDPEFVDKYPGHATMEVLTMCDFDQVSKWDGTRWKKRGADYDAFKEHLTAKLLDALYEQCPQLRGHVAFHELSTPLTTKHFAGHPSGEIYGIACTPDRFEQRAMRPGTGVRGLYMTGADVCSPGVAGAAIGGVLSAIAVTKRNFMSGVMTGPYEPKVVMAPCATSVSAPERAPRPTTEAAE